MKKIRFVLFALLCLCACVSEALNIDRLFGEYKEQNYESSIKFDESGVTFKNANDPIGTVTTYHAPLNLHPVEGPGLLDGLLSNKLGIYYSQEYFTNPKDSMPGWNYATTAMVDNRPLTKSDLFGHESYPRRSTEIPGAFDVAVVFEVQKDDDPGPATLREAGCIFQRGALANMLWFSVNTNRDFTPDHYAYLGTVLHGPKLLVSSSPNFSIKEFNCNGKVNTWAFPATNNGLKIDYPYIFEK